VGADVCQTNAVNNTLTRSLEPTADSLHVFDVDMKLDFEVRLGGCG